VRAFVRFAYEEAWIEEPVTVRRPRLEQKRIVTGEPNAMSAFTLGKPK